MAAKPIHIRNDICIAMSNYNKAQEHNFIAIDSFIVNAILSDAYTSDHELAQLSMSSLSTVKRSINRLCVFGILQKHISKTNQKALTVNAQFLEQFLDQYFYSSPTQVTLGSDFAHV